MKGKKACLGDENEAPFLGPVWESLQQDVYYIRLFLADYFGETVSGARDFHWRSMATFVGLSVSCQDFQMRFREFEKYLRRRKRDVQQALPLLGSGFVLTGSGFRPWRVGRCSRNSKQGLFHLHHDSWR